MKHEEQVKKKLVDDMRALWSFERLFAHRYKRLPSSIEEMRAGFEIGADGYVLKRPIWDARWEAGENGIPAEYDVATSGQNPKKMGAYRFRSIPVVDSTGKDLPLARILAAFPQQSAENDSCFVAPCGPVDLRNDFSFFNAWPVYELKATKDALEFIRSLKSSSLDELGRRLSGDGDLAALVKRTFNGLEWPDQPSGTTAR